jgi:predicted trehalose synthase
LSAPRTAALLAAAALVAAGCQGGAMTEYRFSKDAESLQSLATEGGLLADGVVDGRTTSAFVLTHAQELASDTEKLASVVASTEPEPGLGSKTEQLAVLARRAATRLRQLADHPADPAVAAAVRAALNDTAAAADQLEKSL